MNQLFLKQRMKKQHGFTMIEILVTMIVLAIGIGGLVGLQTISATNANNTLYRYQAMLVAQDMIERMQANRTATYSIAAGAVSGTKCSYGGSTCSNAAAMMTSDAIEWKELIAASGLPGGDGTVVLTTVSGVDIYEVTVSWTNKERMVGNRTVTGDDVANITLKVQI